jgi:hypothetical protein
LSQPCISAIIAETIRTPLVVVRAGDGGPSKLNRQPSLFSVLFLTVRSFWKFILKNWKFSAEEQRTSNAVSLSLWTTTHLTDEGP